MVRVRTLVLLTTLAALCAVLAAGLVLFGGRTFGRSSELPVIGQAPPWKLTDQLGRTVSSTDLRGKVWVANFVYTSCTDTCPALSLKMQLLQNQLRGHGLLGRGVELVSFTTDPKRDTPEVLRRYSRQHGAEPDSWHFLTGTEAEMRAVIVKGFMLGLEDAPQAEATPHDHAADEHHDEGYQVIHSNRFVLVDQQGRIRAYLDGTGLSAEELTKEVMRLVK
ncbi:MAG: SCO family protein [Chloroflexota bacterium]|nr:SCO family protein [Chloroflexota bacterium]